MSSHYVTEPPPTAAVLLHTTAGPIQISLFATQTPLACRNFVQHILDGYYSSTAFHRVVPGFVIQAGDPTGTGEGGQSIYEDREFEIDAKTGERVVFGNELHSRLKFNRRGLVGMAKMGESSYGSQFFITLADVRAQLDGNCTMFGRVEGDGIYNVVRISEAENMEGTERPMYPFKITGAEVLEMPNGDFWANMTKRERVAKRTAPEDEEAKVKKKAKTKKRGKTLLSFGGEEGDEDAAATIKPRTKFNSGLIDISSKNEAIAANGHTSNIPERNSQHPKTQSNDEPAENHSEPAEKHSEPTENHSKPARRGIKPRRRRSSHSSSPRPPARPSKPPESHRRRPSLHDPTTQLPLKNPESPSRSPSRRSSSSATSPHPSGQKASTSHLHAEIAALKASMRRIIPTAPVEPKRKSALEQLIPETSIRGRKRPRPGDSDNHNASAALSLLNQFKSRLEVADHAAAPISSKGNAKAKDRANGIEESPRPHMTMANDDDDTVNAEEKKVGEEQEEHEDEAQLCDLHFIVNCQSCSKWDHHDHHHKNIKTNDNHDRSKTNQPTEVSTPGPNSPFDSDDDADWMTHALSFEKDRLGKDLTWKRKNEEELVVIDPREREKEVLGAARTEHGHGKGRGRGR